MRKYKVLFFGEGKMGELVWSELNKLSNVEVERHSLEAYGGSYARDYDLLFSASYPRRIPQELVKLTALGAVNLHTGLLPEGRGWHPLNWALIWGKEYTGITIHKIVDSYDAGDVCVKMVVPILKTDNIVALRERVDLGVPEIISLFFEDVEGNIKNAKKQNQALVTYAPKRRPEDSELNLEAEPEQVYNLFRSCDPVEYPAFLSTADGEKMYVKSVSMDGKDIYLK